MCYAFDMHRADQKLSAFLRLWAKIGRFVMKPRGRFHFLATIPERASVLDVGCGNNSPIRTKRVQPRCTYIGIDVGDYNQANASVECADTYTITSPEGFADEIARFRGSADAVISCHNIEHCGEPDKVIKAMCEALKPCGRLYMSFPCAESASFPKRKGTLNFFDDVTHKAVPDFERVLAQLRLNGLELTYVARRSRPPLLFLVGLLVEPWSALSRRIVPFGVTWALYGFETIIWANKPAAHENITRTAA